MSGIENMMARKCTQTAVYWGTGPLDVYTNETFATPVEISCRWEDHTGEFINNKGEIMFSKAEVYLTQDVDVGGYLYLGDLDDLSSNPDDPMDEENAVKIQRFDKVPALGSTTKFVRKVYL